MTKPTWLLDFFRAQNETAEACATLRRLVFCLARVGLNESACAIDAARGKDVNCVSSDCQQQRQKSVTGDSSSIGRIGE